MRICHNIYRYPDKTHKYANIDRFCVPTWVESPHYTLHIYMFWMLFGFMFKWTTITTIATWKECSPLMDQIPLAELTWMMRAGTYTYIHTYTISLWFCQKLIRVVRLRKWAHNRVIAKMNGKQYKANAGKYGERKAISKKFVNPELWCSFAKCRIIINSYILFPLIHCSSAELWVWSLFIGHCCFGFLIFYDSACNFLFHFW